MVTTVDKKGARFLDKVHPPFPHSKQEIDGVKRAPDEVAAHQDGETHEEDEKTNVGHAGTVDTPFCISSRRSHVTPCSPSRGSKSRDRRHQNRNGVAVLPMSAKVHEFNRAQEDKKFFEEECILLKLSEECYRERIMRVEEFERRERSRKAMEERLRYDVQHCCETNRSSAAAEEREVIGVEVRASTTSTRRSTDELDTTVPFLCPTSEGATAAAAEGGSLPPHPTASETKMSETSQQEEEVRSDEDQRNSECIPLAGVTDPLGREDHTAALVHPSSKWKRETKRHSFSSLGFVSSAVSEKEGNTVEAEASLIPLHGIPFTEWMTNEEEKTISTPTVRETEQDAPMEESATSFLPHPLHSSMLPSTGSERKECPFTNSAGGIAELKLLLLDAIRWEKQMQEKLAFLDYQERNRWSVCESMMTHEKNNENDTTSPSIAERLDGHGGEQENIYGGSEPVHQKEGIRELDLPAGSLEKEEEEEEEVYAFKRIPFSAELTQREVREATSRREEKNGFGLYELWNTVLWLVWNVLYVPLQPLFAFLGLWRRLLNLDNVPFPTDEGRKTRSEEKSG